MAIRSFFSFLFLSAYCTFFSLLSFHLYCKIISTLHSTHIVSRHSNTIDKYHSTSTHEFSINFLFCCSYLLLQCDMSSIWDISFAFFWVLQILTLLSSIVNKANLWIFFSIFSIAIMLLLFEWHFIRVFFLRNIESCNLLLFWFEVENLHDYISFVC